MKLINTYGSKERTALSLTGASSTAAIILRPAAVEGLPGGDGNDFAVRFGRGCRGEAARVAVACKHCRQEKRGDASKLAKGQHCRTKVWDSNVRE